MFHGKLKNVRLSMRLLLATIVPLVYDECEICALKMLLLFDTNGGGGLLLQIRKTT